MQAQWQRRAAGLVAVIAALAQGQSVRRPDTTFTAAHPNIVVPQARAFAPPGSRPIVVSGVTAGIVIVEQVATTTLDIALHNPGPAAQAELLVPVPEGAVVRGFAFAGQASEPTATVLAREEAQRTYHAIVAKVRDPALLEFAGCNLVRSCVFPVPAGGTQKVRLTYEHVLPRAGDRVDYVLPRSESLACAIPWDISIKIKAAAPIAAVYSPSHNLVTARSAANIVTAGLAGGPAAPGPLRLSYLLAQEGVSASLLAYPDARLGGGYFLLLAGLPPELPPALEAAPVRREVTLVLDRSGSMTGKKLNQARAAALQVLAGLEDGEAFNLIVYDTTVDRLAKTPVPVSDANLAWARRYLDAVQAGQSTNLYDALAEALRPPPPEGLLPLVLFLTDGLPTSGNTSEVAIRQLATEHNPHHRRIFTFGVGVDVNAPLLEKLADESRGTATFVLPGENVEAQVARVFAALSGPVLTDARLEVVASHGAAVPGRVSHVLPARLPDLYRGEQLVVLGQYHTSEPLRFTLHGNYLGTPRTFRFEFPLESATTRNAFVPRLWASRQIAALVDAIRQLGAEPATAAAAARRDPRLAELTQEILRLSTEYGILTEYTAFLAREGTDLSRPDEVLAQASATFHARALATRSGLGAINQSANHAFASRQTVLNLNNSFLDENMNRVSIATVQQVNDQAFFRRNGRWVEGRALGPELAGPPRTVAFGTPEFAALAERLAGEGRTGCLALEGDLLLLVDGERVLVTKSESGK